MDRRLGSPHESCLALAGDGGRFLRPLVSLLCFPFFLHSHSALSPSPPHILNQYLKSINLQCPQFFISPEAISLATLGHPCPSGTPCRPLSGSFLPKAECTTTLKECCFYSFSSSYQLLAHGVCSRMLWMTAGPLTWVGSGHFVTPSIGQGHSIEASIQGRDACNDLKRFHTRLTFSPVLERVPLSEVPRSCWAPVASRPSSSPFGVGQQTCFIPPAICGVSCPLCSGYPALSTQPHPVSWPHEQSGQQSPSSFLPDAIPLSEGPPDPSHSPCCPLAVPFCPSLASLTPSL